MTTIIFATNPATETFSAVADSQVTMGTTAQEIPLSQSKIFSPPRADHLLLGFAGDVSVKTALRSLNIPSKHKKDFSDEQANNYMYTVVVPAIRDHLNMSFLPGSEFVYGPSFGLLVWLKDTKYVFEINTDFSVLSNNEGFYSVGSGSQHAKASFRLRPELDIIQHMDFASENDLFTSGPYHQWKDSNAN